jgi:hypothetical protein
VRVSSLLTPLELIFDHLRNSSGASHQIEIEFETQPNFSADCTLAAAYFLWALGKIEQSLARRIGDTGYENPGGLDFAASHVSG